MGKIEKPPRICEDGGSGIFIRGSYWRDALPNETSWDPRYR